MRHCAARHVPVHRCHLLFLIASLSIQSPASNQIKINESIQFNSIRPFFCYRLSYRLTIEIDLNLIRVVFCPIGAKLKIIQDLSFNINKELSKELNC